MSASANIQSVPGSSFYFRDSIASKFKWLSEACHPVTHLVRCYSRPVGQVALLGLDIIFFAGKVSKEIPEKLTRGSLVLLSGAGLLFFPYNIDYIVKSCYDTAFGIKSSNLFVLFSACAKTVELV